MDFNGATPAHDSFEPLQTCRSVEVGERAFFLRCLSALNLPDKKPACANYHHDFLHPRQSATIV